MIKIITKVLLLLFFVTMFSACDQIENSLSGKGSYTYKQCLKESFNGNHSFNAEEVRSLCQEIVGANDPSYEFKNGELVPSDDFTKCYEKQKEELKKQGSDNPDEIAKLVCKYASD